MSEEINVKIDWISKRQEDDIYREITDIRSNMLGMILSIYGDEFNKCIPVKSTKEIEFKNFIIDDVRGNISSNLSVEGTIGMLYNEDDYFIIPPDLIKYIQINIRSGLDFNLYEEHLPLSVEELDKGKELYLMLRDKGFSYQGAYAICGMLYARSKWDPTYYDEAEFDIEWSRRKEGLLALNRWPDKYTMITTLGLHRHASFEKSFKGFKSVTNDETRYNARTYGLISMCDLETWIKILLEYIHRAEKNPADEKNVEMYIKYDRKPRQTDDHEDEDHKLLYAAYLLTYSKLYSKTFASIEKRINDERSEEISKGIPSSEIVNSFIQMLLTAKMLSQYCCDVPIDDINFLDIFPSFGHLTLLSFEGGFGDKTYKGKVIPIHLEKPNAKGITVANHTAYMYKRSSQIKYIILHYSASVTSGNNNAVGTIKTLDKRALSSDFAVDDTQIIQFADDITKWHSSACQAWSSSGTPAGRYATNNNAVSIEMSSTLGPGGAWHPNDPHFYFTKEVLDNTRYLCCLLVKEYNIPKENVIRHYDIMGKPCPGIIGWNLAKGSDNDNKYREFVNSIYDNLDSAQPLSIMHQEFETYAPEPKDKDKVTASVSTSGTTKA